MCNGNCQGNNPWVDKLKIFRELGSTSVMA